MFVVKSFTDCDDHNNNCCPTTSVLLHHAAIFFIKSGILNCSNLFKVHPVNVFCGFVKNFTILRSKILMLTESLFFFLRENP